MRLSQKIKNKKLVVMILYTVLFLVIWRLGYYVQLPYIDLSLFTGQDKLFGFLDIFSGGALSTFSILSLGISPYITASIVVQLLQMDIVPILKEWADEGETGRKKINQITRYLALMLALVQSLILTISIDATYYGTIFVAGVSGNAFVYVYLAIVTTAGTAFVLWLADKITSKGIGNGTSMMIVAGIVASFPDMIRELSAQFLASGTNTTGDIFIFFGVLIILIIIIVGIVFMEKAQRKIPIQYANRPATASFRGKSDSNIPLKINSASVIPVIFASTLMSIPTTVLNFLETSTTTEILKSIFSITYTSSSVVSINPVAFVLYIILIFVFSFFYAFLQMDPEKMAENLQKQNAYIPGIKPGDATAAYISRVLFKITMVGATYLTIIAIIPTIATVLFNLPGSVQIGGTSLIIVVGVALETAKQIKTESQEKQYRGFIE